MGLELISVEVENRSSIIIVTIYIYIFILVYSRYIIIIEAVFAIRTMYSIRFHAHRFINTPVSKDINHSKPKKRKPVHQSL